MTVEKCCSRRALAAAGAVTDRMIMNLCGGVSPSKTFAPANERIERIEQEFEVSLLGRAIFCGYLRQAGVLLDPSSRFHSAQRWHLKIHDNRVDCFLPGAVQSLPAHWLPRRPRVMVLTLAARSRSKHECYRNKAYLRTFERRDHRSNRNRQNYSPIEERKEAGKRRVCASPRYLP